MFAEKLDSLDVTRYVFLVRPKGYQKRHLIFHGFLDELKRLETLLIRSGLLVFRVQN